MGFFAKGHDNEFETALVNEPSMFEPLEVYCNSIEHIHSNKHLSSREPGLVDWVFAFHIGVVDSVPTGGPCMIIFFTSIDQEIYTHSPLS